MNTRDRDCSNGGGESPGNDASRSNACGMSMCDSHVPNPAHWLDDGFTDDDEVPFIEQEFGEPDHGYDDDRDSSESHRNLRHGKDAGPAS